MITLYGGGEGFGLPEMSPYVTKTEVQLKMAGLPYRKELGRPEDGPKGQVPFIEHNGTRIGDSTFIRGYIERTYGVDFDEGLNPAERAQAWAIERMVENHLGWTLTHARWLIPANFAKGPARFFDDVPAPMRETVRRDVSERVRATLYTVGVGRHNEMEIVALGVRSLDALSTLICDKPYLFGDRPCGADATVFAFLAHILTPFFDSELRYQAEGFEDLVRYTDRLMAEFYPGFPWRLACRSAEAA